jgi:hypothetical protein
VEATFTGNPGFPAAFVATGRVLGDPAATRITGVVLDNSNNPVPGATIRAYLTNVPAQASQGIPPSIAVRSDSQGQFAIQPAPIGFVKLIADGSTVTRPGQWPNLEYDLVTVAGRNNTIGMPVYLLPLDTTDLLCVSETAGGTLTLPQVPGFSMTVQPGSATFPGGSKTGCISVTPVHPDKIPMVPGFGQQPRFIVTIQPAGTLFNPPAAITVPNLEALGRREVTEMYSFDHDLGTFVSIGTGTVSDDGTVVQSDPGVGVLKAGWFCDGNPGATGTAAVCPVCQICEGSGCKADPAQDNKRCTSGETKGMCKAGTCVPAVPVNFRQTNVSSQPDGTLHFDYAWDSSTGVLDDLVNCQISEKVTYPGPDPFFWPSPPWINGTHNPEIRSVAATDGQAPDDHGTKPFVTPYKAATFTASQDYLYQCSDVNGGEPILIQFQEIVRSVIDNHNGTFRYVITKSGASAGINPLPQ